MHFKKFKQEKLWRDKAIDMLESQGSILRWRMLNDEEFARELRVKFMEEAQEVVAASTQETLIEELADIMEVISSLCALHNFSTEDILAAKARKKENRGGFDGRRYVSVAEHQVGSFGEAYCLADPEKYPEII